MSGDRISRGPLRRRCGPVAGVARTDFCRRRRGQRRCYATRGRGDGQGRGGRGGMRGGSACVG
ncbi:hypothetical protein ERO13_A11G030071v2 [Gossypium hirsutum]|nr:hypothetical protein ERO13_A11G030071v2 [Gossypium hirsutum]